MPGKPWEAGVFYPLGSMVEYAGRTYKIIQPHTSQSDWMPSVTPALWGQTADRNPAPAPQGLSSSQARLQESSPNPVEQLFILAANAPPPHFQKLPRPPFSIGYAPEYIHVYPPPQPNAQFHSRGAISARNPLPTPAPPPVLPLHTRPHVDRAATCDSPSPHYTASRGDSWLADAQRRTDDFRQNGPRAPTTWVLTHNDTRVPDALVAGQGNDGEPLAIRRAHCDGQIIIGSGPFPGAHEILLGDLRGVQWVHSSALLSRSPLCGRPVDAGPSLYIARAHRGESIDVGSCSTSSTGASIGGHLVQDYEMLCYN